jgi:pilus assembly protein Flp/PilA
VSSVPFQPGDKGQGLVEFALVLVLIAIVVIAIYLLVEPAIGDIIAVVKEALGL